MRGDVINMHNTNKVGSILRITYKGSQLSVTQKCIKIKTAFPKF